jgi:hypothetical protein
VSGGSDPWPWLALIGLGAFHGINPAMGWLFAVGLGLQRQSGKAVLQALPPIALGHAGAIALAIAAVAAAKLSADATVLRIAAGACLIAFGVYRLMRGYRHQFRVGMRVGFADLLSWSFLMATAHGAGVMVLPALIELPASSPSNIGDHGDHAAALAAQGGMLWIGVLAVTVHTLAMLVVAGVIAWVVYAVVGLAVLRRAWINLDLLWSLALVGIGVVYLLFGAISLGATGALTSHGHP